MRVYISVDMEGIGGIATPEDCDPGHAEYERSRRLMTAEANAAVEGAVAGGATEILVNDAHDGMANLLPELLDRRAWLVRGGHKPWGMMQGLDESYDAAFLIGYHARQGTREANLAHTLTGPTVQDVWLNDEPAGELLLNTSLAGWHGVPVMLVSGDEAAVREAMDVAPSARVAVVKTAVGNLAAVSLHPDEACALVRAEAEIAMQEAPAALPYPRASRFRLQVRFAATAVAQACLHVPGVEEVDERTVVYTSPSMQQAYGVMSLFCTVASAVGRQRGYA